VADDAVETARRMLELKSLGVAISLDDFGTGYSSLSYLRQFPIDSLKIDSSFVRNIPGSADANAIASAIAVMAKALNLETIAEGVETREQSDFLVSLGVDLCQGYLFARPLTPEQFDTYVLNDQNLE
jgi:EAL domain-containing protein (putative c-di-GMP-specific phosphodiesterase class I)